MNTKEESIVSMLYTFIVGVLQGNVSEPVSARVKLLPTGDVELKKATRKVTIAEAIAYAKGLVNLVIAGTAGSGMGKNSNSQGVPKNFTGDLKAFATMTHGDVMTTWCGYGNRWLNAEGDLCHARDKTILFVVLQRSLNYAKPKPAERPPKKQRVSAAKKTAAPKVTPAVARAELKRRKAKRKDGKHRPAKNVTAQRMSGKELSTIGAK